MLDLLPQLVANILVLTISHIKREANKLADWKTNKGVTRKEEHVDFPCPINLPTSLLNDYHILAQ